MDSYTKVMLTIIAICLIIISIRITPPTPAYGGLFNNDTPTYSDLIDMRNLEPEQRKQHLLELQGNTPLIFVWRVLRTVDVDID